VQLLNQAVLERRFARTPTWLWRSEQRTLDALKAAGREPSEWTPADGFPLRFRVGPNSVGWDEAQIDAYIAACPRGPRPTPVLAEEGKKGQQKRWAKVRAEQKAKARKKRRAGNGR